MAVLCNICKMIRFTSLAEKDVSRVCSNRLISTSSIASKRGPGSVGVPAWAKAANKRRAQVLLVDKQKTLPQMQAEARLADEDSNKSNFLTTSRVGVHRPKKNTESDRMKLAISGNMLLFYHPKQDYPVHHTKSISDDINIADTMEESSSSNDYDNNLSESQIAEIKLLQRKDPKLWTVDILSDMYKVRPLEIINCAPLNDDQLLQLEVEQDFLATLSDYEKKEYTYFKNDERRKQLRKMRK